MTSHLENLHSVKLGPCLCCRALAAKCATRDMGNAGCVRAASHTGAALLRRKARTQGSLLSSATLLASSKGKASSTYTTSAPTIRSKQPNSFSSAASCFASPHSSRRNRSLSMTARLHSHSMDVAFRPPQAAICRLDTSASRPLICVSDYSSAACIPSDLWRGSPREFVVRMQAEGVAEGPMQHCACSLTWHWCKHCAPGGAAFRGCRLWPPPSGSGAAQQTQPQDSRRSQSQGLASLCISLSVSACHMPALGLQLAHLPINRPATY